MSFKCKLIQVSFCQGLDILIPYNVKLRVFKQGVGYA